MTHLIGRRFIAPTPGKILGLMTHGSAYKIEYNWTRLDEVVYKKLSNYQI